MQKLWILAALCLAPALFGQAEYRVYSDHPRLFLDPDRLGRLRKDVDRQSLRWQMLSELVEGGELFPEQPLVDALLFATARDTEAAESAIRWVSTRSTIETASELRQAAIVFDWCYERFTPETRKRVAELISTTVAELVPRANLGVDWIRSATLATLAVSGDWSGSEAATKKLLEGHWRDEVQPALDSGKLVDDGGALIAVLEVCHAVRYSIEVDLWERNPAVFQTLTRTRLLSYYPDDLEHGVHRPAVFGADADLATTQSALFRIAEMMLVAYEGNSQEFQFLQGWLRNDSYSLKSLLSAPYEFLWVNPYLPGLTPQSSPVLAHDPLRGRIYGRNSWSSTDFWLGYVGGRMEIVAGGESTFVTAADKQAPLLFPGSAVILTGPRSKWTLQIPTSGADPLTNRRIYLVGLKPGDRYAVKVNRRQSRLVTAGAGGIIVLFNDPEGDKRDVIDFEKKIRLEIQPTLKSTDPRRKRPTLAN